MGDETFHSIRGLPSTLIRHFGITRLTGAYKMERLRSVSRYSNPFQRIPRYSNSFFRRERYATFIFRQSTSPIGMINDEDNYHKPLGLVKLSL